MLPNMPSPCVIKDSTCCDVISSKVNQNNDLLIGLINCEVLYFYLLICFGRIYTRYSHYNKFCSRKRKNNNTSISTLNYNNYALLQNNIKQLLTWLLLFICFKRKANTCEIRTGKSKHFNQ